ncbi:MAG: DNA polymerase III subunit beta [Synergistaceae bacterium]|jgi:DNA polymerase-3 subunit beta|nr:DNA polymerase III subunit beta [Synergistaceae bacterium]
MKIDIVRSEFLKTWQMAERCSSSKSTISSLGGVLLTAEDNKVSLSATDLKTSICCAAEGVYISRDGAAILPVKLLGELFKKVSEDRFTVEVKDEKGLLVAGRNKTRFSTWPIDEFPKLAQSDGAEIMCDVLAGDFSRILAEGSIASSPTDDFPKYLGACQIQLKGGALHVISTDSRRLSLSKHLCEGENNAELLLPILPLRELQRLLTSVTPETPVRILYDGSLAWFQIGQIEFSIRRVESTFPSYERILNPNRTNIMTVKRDELISALERIDIIVRSHTRVVVMHFSPRGQLKLTGKAPEFGTVVEVLDADINGDPLKAGFNVGFLQDGLKAVGSEKVLMNLNGEAGQMTLCRDGSDDFLYMLMPVRITEQDMIDPEEEEESLGVEEPVRLLSDVPAGSASAVAAVMEESRVLESLKALEEISRAEEEK